ncbi:MAG TPA: ABC transporter permease [Acidobacteriaceae bacterium]|nr:ABC transporter permease [Acidobacteriaceae bacterium]
MINDLRFALRQLHKSPGFTLAAILTLALGIGATTAIFTLVYDAMLRPLPFTRGDRLVTIAERVAAWSNLYPSLPVNANHFTFWQQHSHSFQSMAVMEQESMPLGANGRPLQIGVLSATPGFFSVLQVQPRLGRAFTAAQAQPGHDHVAVLLYSLWHDEFGADPNILGKTVTLNGYPYTVIGVMPASFHMPPAELPSFGARDKLQPLGVLVPMAFSKGQLQEAMGDFNYFGLARLKPGVTVAQASAELNAEQHTISAGLSADEKATLSANLTPWQQDLVGNSRTPLIVLLAAVAGLLLVACVNIANLLLARAVGQKQQLAVAAALGASRVEMLALSMRETVVLALTGGGLGILLAATLVPLMQNYLPPALNFRGPLHLDWIGAFCALLLAMLATLLAGAAPAWLSSRTAPQEVLHSESKLASESRGSKRMRRVLVAVEVAVSVALLLMTGLLTMSLVKLMRVDRGFNPERTITAKVDLPRESYPDTQHRAEFYKEVLGQLRRLPGVEHAALASVLPLGGDYWGDTIRLPGDTRPYTALPTQHFRWISPGYFASIHLPLVAGRPLSEDDWNRNVALISERTAKTLWPGKDPIGQQFRRAGNPDEKPFTVIGVVKNARTITLAKPDPMIVYVPYWYRCDDSGELVIRTYQDPTMMASAIRKAIWSVDRSVPIPAVRTLGGIMADSVANRRFEMDLLLVFAISALLLAGLGVYGVLTYSVVQRQKEIGLRLALGAQRGSIYGLVLRDGLLPVAVGTVAGIVITFALARLISSLLFGVSPYSPAITLAAAATLIGVGIVACLLPARKAANIEPMEALRTE